MNRSWLIVNQYKLEKLLKVVKTLLRIALLVSIGFYIASIIVLEYGHSLVAVLLATTGFFIFHLMRNNCFSIAKLWLGRNAGHEEMLQFLDKKMSGKSQADYMKILEKALGTVK